MLSTIVQFVFEQIQEDKCGRMYKPFGAAGDESAPESDELSEEESSVESPSSLPIHRTKPQYTRGKRYWYEPQLPEEQNELNASSEVALSSGEQFWLTQLSRKFSFVDVHTHCTVTTLEIQKKMFRHRENYRLLY